MLALLALTFAAGAAYECGCVFWVHYATEGRSALAVGFSMFNAVVTIIGVEQFLKSWRFKLAYVLGFGFGTWVALEVIGRWLGHGRT